MEIENREVRNEYNYHFSLFAERLLMRVKRSSNAESQWIGICVLLFRAPSGQTAKCQIDNTVLNASEATPKQNKNVNT